MHSWDRMHSIPGESMAACSCGTYINYRSACFTHCSNSYLNDTTCTIMLYKHISNYPVICDVSYFLLLLLLQNLVKAEEEWGGGASGETWAGCLRKSRFEHPPIPPHPPHSRALINSWDVQTPLCVNLAPRFCLISECCIYLLWVHLIHTGVRCSYDTFAVITRQQTSFAEVPCQELITALSICINLIKPACCTNCNVGDLRLIRVTTKTVIT